MNILIVDDDPIALRLIATVLEHDGHDVETAEDADGALKALHAGRARVLISDWEMPGMSGPELCQAVRASDLSRYVYMILLTARDSQRDLVEGLRAGADDFLTKPFDPLELSVRLSVAERVTSLETRDLMIFGMAKLAESRDRETGKHLERVRAYCRVLAMEMRKLERHAHTIDAEFVKHIYMTSPLHDIGKVGIPDSILLKSDRLTELEFEVMKTHAAIGAETLEAALREFPGVKFLEMARDIAWAHHERWDGGGYPRRLSGSQIPLAARILAVADVYDALRSPRVYKPALDHRTTSDMIVRESGKHFDPDVVEAFRGAGSEFEAISRVMMDPQTQLPAAA